MDQFETGDLIVFSDIGLLGSLTKVILHYLDIILMIVKYNNCCGFISQIPLISPSFLSLSVIYKFKL